MSDWIGKTISKVEIQERLGRGGMADVYLGRHTTLDRPVAVKLLHTFLSEDASLLTRFKDEAQVVANFRHGNIVQVLDYDVAEDHPYIVMEYIEGMALNEYLKTLHSSGNVLPVETTTRLIEAIASALDYAHQRGVIHRDIKPANVMLRREDGLPNPPEPLPDDVQAILTDFGIARIAHSTAQTASGTVIGTPAYMSPEQVRGETVDLRSDIYSLGIMAYEMLAGRAPFDPETETAASIMVKQMTEDPPPLPDAPPELQAVLNRALAKIPAQRYSSAGEMASALKDTLGGAEWFTAAMTLPPVSTPPPSIPTGQQDKPEKSGVNPLVWLAGGGIVALGVLGAIIVGAILVATGAFGKANADPTPDPGIAIAEAEGADAQSDAAAPPVAATGGAAAEASQSVSAVGQALFRDTTLSVSLADIEGPPDGSVYQAWLADEENPALNAGVIEVVGGNLNFDFTDPSGAALVGQYTRFFITVEPEGANSESPTGDAVYHGELSAETSARLRLLLEVSRGAPLQDALLNGVSTQAGAYNSHLGFALDAIQSGNISAAKSHSEHVINIVEGKGSEVYADWDGNGLTENPGDEFGLLPYLLTLQEAMQAIAAAPDTSADDRALAESTEVTLGELAIQSEDASILAQRISAADTTDELQPLVEEIQTLLGLQDSLTQVLAEVGRLELATGVEVFASGQ